MAHQWLRVNLGAAIFPFASDLWGRSVIIPQIDQNYYPSIAAVSDPVRDRGIPQAFYMHNVIPTAQGYQSVGYNLAIRPKVEGLNPSYWGPTYWGSNSINSLQSYNNSGWFANIPIGFLSPDDFDRIFILQSNVFGIKSLFVPAQGKNYIYDPQVSEWQSVSPIPTNSLPPNLLVTTAHVNGQTYFYYSQLGCFKYIPGAEQIEEVILAGLVKTEVRGICEANGYMIAFTPAGVFNSSRTNELDFVPSLITGAGGGLVQEVKGEINVCLQIAGGFIIYSSSNIVAGKYSGNSSFPWIFTEISGGGGVSSPEMVSWYGTLDEHFCWTDAGIQQVDLGGATNIFPEATDFIAKKLFEDFDESTLLFSEQYLKDQMNMRVVAISDRFVVFSYGINFPDFTHALIFDTALKRWGKFKFDHRDCFQWQGPLLGNRTIPTTYDQLFDLTYDELKPLTYDDLNSVYDFPDAPLEDIAFLQKDGSVYIVNFDLSGTTADGVLIVGKFQLERNKFIEHQKTDIENARFGNVFDYHLLTTLDGKTFLPAIAPKKISEGPLIKRYAKRVQAQNISMLFTGSFNLVSVQMDFTLGGDR